MQKINNILYESMQPYNTYKQWANSLIELAPTEKGHLFEYFCYYILKFHPDFKNNISELYLLKLVPTNLLTALNITKQDRGIDIVCKYNGMYHTVQVKFRANTKRKIPWKDVSTFLGSTFRSKCEKGIFITNCYDVVDDMRHENIKLIYGSFWNETINTIYDEIKQFLNNTVTHTTSRRNNAGLQERTQSGTNPVNNAPIYANAPQPIYTNAPQPIYNNAPQPIYTNAPQPTYNYAPQPKYNN
jgi:hypothetical protein